MPPAPDALRIEGLRKSFGSREVLSGVSLAVPAGSCTALLGPSGSGKSTLLRIAAGLETADAGRVTIAGRLADDPEQRIPVEQRNVGMLFQELALWPHMTVAGNLSFVLEARQVPASERAGRIDAAVAGAGLPRSLLDRRPPTLSGGERQRAALARLLVQGTSLFLLDEPLSHLDPHLRHGLLDALAALREERGIAYLIVTHDQTEAFALADTVVVLRDGRVEQQGTPESIYRSPASRFVAEFVGRCAFVDAEARGGRVATPFGDVPAPGPDGRRTLVYRPETVRLRDGAGSAAGDAVREAVREAVRGTVRSVRFGDGAWIASVDVPFGAAAWRLLVRADRAPAPGDAVGLEATPPSVLSGGKD